MKVIFSLVLLGVTAALADVAPYPPSGWKPQSALLVLPPPTPNVQPQQDETENVEQINQREMERLRQEFGSEVGVYHVYLPDGRLQRVQYTTAPIKQNLQQYQTRQYDQYRQNNDRATNTPPGNQQSNHQIVFGTNKHSNQGNQQQFNRQQQQFGESRQFVQLQDGQYQYAQQRQQDNNGADTANPSKLLAQYKQTKAQNELPTSYVASVHFTDVPPVTGPIFAYNPSPLVRVVRYAENFY